MLHEYNRKLRSVQTYKVEEWTFGTLCVLTLKVWSKFTEKNMGLLWQMCHYKHYQKKLRFLVKQVFPALHSFTLQQKKNSIKENKEILVESRREIVTMYHALTHWDIYFYQSVFTMRNYKGVVWFRINLNLFSTE